MLNNLLGGTKNNASKDSIKTNSTPKEQLGNAVKDGIKGLFGKKKNQ